MNNQQLQSNEKLHNYTSTQGCAPIHVDWVHVHLSSMARKKVYLLSRNSKSASYFFAKKNQSSSSVLLCDNNNVMQYLYTGMKTSLYLFYGKTCKEALIDCGENHVRIVL